MAAMKRIARLACAGALAAALTGGARAEPPCTPLVRVTGEPALAGPVIALLRERGLPVDRPGECGTLTAVLTANGERTRITIVDAEGRTVERMAEDARAAATAIESWARGDLAAPLLAARDAPTRQAQSVDREAPPLPRPPPIVIERLIEVGAGADAGLASDGAVWTGARAHACVNVGPVCAGALVRYQLDTEARGDSILRDTSRSALDLLLTAELPLRRGRAALWPGVAIGQTSLRATRRSQDRERIDRSSLTMRASAAVGYRVAGAWWLRADLALGWCPFGARQLEEISGGEEEPDPQDGEPLAGFAAIQGWFGVGLVYGGL
jgi:hypothetical protein